MVDRDDPTAEVTDLLSTLIRNRCVNDGTPESGGETASADVLASVLSGAGLDVESYEPRPGRRSVLARIEGTDPTAPTLLLMGHTDVVPVNEDAWTRDPFSGEVVDGMVWGRGAVDMLNLTASMAVAVRRLADSGFRPRGTLAYLAVADEEALGTWGADWLVAHELDHVKADYVVTETGGWAMSTPNGLRLPVMVEEKGTFWTRITVHGTPGHASSPYRTDNALVTAAEVVRRVAAYRPPALVRDVWRSFVEGMSLPAELLDADGLDDYLASLPPGLARIAYSSTHTTFAPTMAHGGTKTNVIPDSVVLEVDVRTMPGESGDAALAMLREAIGDLLDKVDIESHDDASTSSAVDTPLWDALGRTTARLCAGSALVPMIMVGGTDNRFFRRAGAVGYGFGLFSERVPLDRFLAMFHGNDEHVDQESLALSTRLWEGVARDFLA